jgi:two-component system NtrC family sensor kinase
MIVPLRRVMTNERLPAAMRGGGLALPDRAQPEKRRAESGETRLKLRRPSRRLLKSISVRISATCWLVTLLTLALYVAVNLPQQKKDLLDALRSKAQGISSSLQDVTAGAAMPEDYSKVADRCIRVLRGDDAIEYLVITKANGFSVIVERSGWRTGMLDRSWRPAGQGVAAQIAYVPLAGKRVFRYTRPLDYSGTRWGWVSVGLSTAAYDQSVARVHQRAALLAVLGAVMSLLISFGQARRLVRPIVTLQGVVGQVANGDLSARADLRSGDEVEDLARSFNLMADTILARNRILESVRIAGQQLLSADDWAGIVEEVLAKIGQAAGVSRAYVFENHPAADGTLLSSERYEWVAPGVASTIAKWQNLRWAGSGLDDWPARLAAGQVVVAASAEFDERARQRIDPSIRTVISTPIRVGNVWWGLLGFDECVRGREWGNAEKDSFRAVADMLGAAIARQSAKRALVEANESLEHRVLKRTRELQEQVKAKEAANAQLAEAQQRLMSLSRQAGMAEVATGVLHNVGNVLNSVNVSASIVAGKVRESRIGNLVTLAGMLEEHTGDLPDFLTHDAKGQRVVPYLLKLANHLEEERRGMLRELESLTEHVEHIKEIVATQQSYAKVSGLIEVVPLEDLVEDSIRIVEPGLVRHGIRLERAYEAAPAVAVDKHSVLQILLNLLRNAKQALKDSDNPEKYIRVCIYRQGEDRIRISVEDTGVGVPGEHLTKIFSHGFTTRRDGHGFGLHSGANAARRMGGMLWAESDGPGRGATFILELPMSKREAAKDTPRV